MRRAAAALLFGWTAVLLSGLAAQAGEPAIWRIDGGPRPVWLFGTFHLPLPGPDWRNALIGRAFETSDALVLETIQNDQSMAAAQAIIRQRAFQGPDRTLRDLLHPEERVTLEMIGNRLGMFPAILDAYRPWYASMLLTLALHQEQGFTPSAAMATALQRQAETMGKTVKQLQTAREQFETLSLMPEHIQLDLLRATLAEAAAMPRKISAMQTAWLTGDVARLDKLLNGTTRQHAAAHERLLAQRNGRWLPRIAAMVNDRNSYFIAVDVAHLVGSDGVVAQLRAKGYRVAGP